MRSEVKTFRAQTLSQVAAVALLAGLTAACSGDSSRFRGPAFTASTDNQRSIIGGSGQAMPPPVDTADASDLTGSVPPRTVSRSNLPPPVLPSGQPVAAQPPVAAAPPVYQPEPATVAEVARPARLDTPKRGGWQSAGGTRVTLGPGDTLFSVSRRYGVPVDAIASANGISDPGSVRVGQDLLIPTYVYGRNAPVSAPDVEPRTRAAAEAPRRQPEMRLESGPAPAAERPRVAANDAPAGVHTVSQGQSLSSIARLYNVTVADLVAANGLSSPNAIRSGQRLRIPGHSPEPAAVAMRTEPARREDRPRGEDPDGRDRVASTTPAAQPAGTGAAADPDTTASVPGRPVRVVGTPTTEPPQSGDRASIARPATPPAAEQPVAYAPSAEPERPAATVDTADPGSANGTTFRWPVRGRIISGFGGQSGGERNDGINLAVPEGTSVKAAEAGTVIYAGSELEGYGQLVLVRHADGWVSAYAHNSEILVKRGDTVRRGQIISRAGKSGSVTQPQLHFELRRGSRPVNPLDYLAGA